MCLLPNMVISAARRTLWPHDFQIIQARPDYRTAALELLWLCREPESPAVCSSTANAVEIARVYMRYRSGRVTTAQEHEQMLRERQLSKHGGSKMHLVGAQPPYQLWYLYTIPLHPHRTPPQPPYYTADASSLKTSRT